MRRLAIAVALSLVPSLAAAQTHDAHGNGNAGGYPPYAGHHPGHHRTLPPWKHGPGHAHHGDDRFGSRTLPYAPTVVIDGNAFLTPASPAKSVTRTASSSTSTQQQDQFDRWVTEKP